MTTATQAIYDAMTPKRFAREVREAREALRLAWTHRHTHPMRSRIVITSNVQFLRYAATR